MSICMNDCLCVYTHLQYLILNMFYSALCISALDTFMIKTFLIGAVVSSKKQMEMTTFTTDKV